jgi:hypothetical protein
MGKEDKMRCLESPKTRKDPMFWHRRQTLASFRQQTPMFRQLMVSTKSCMAQHPELRNNIKGAIQCETIHPQTLSKFSNFTFHTHPHAINYPSDKDKETTSNLGKDYLLIGVVPENKVYVYNKKDGFEQPVSVFSVGGY